MIKVVALFNRKPGLSLEQFIDYYENNHVPLVSFLIPFMVDYRRSYVRETLMAGAAANPLDFDVMTESWFANRDRFDSFLAALSEPAANARVVADEEKFIDRSRLRVFLVEEHLTATS
jgi:hypothetical protein